MLKRLTLLSLLAFLTVPPGAFAGVVQLPQTGQTFCNDVGGRTIGCPGTGQDGDLRAGLAWPIPRFAANADTTLTDTLTGLTWAGDSNVMVSRNPQFDGDENPDGKVNWQHALDYLAKLNSENYLGHNDWRLPNLNELTSLVHAELNSDAAWLKGVGFVNVQSDGYWSSTSMAAGNINAWVVDFKDGRLFFSNKAATNRQSLHYVWPVRGSAKLVPATGQITSVAPQDDGNLRAGVPWPEQRFTDSGDATLRDNLTGLIWSKDANAPGPMECGPRRIKFWEDAFAFVKCINQSAYLGHADWRVPNRNEMRSLINYGAPSYAAGLIRAGFVNVQSSRYWTSTTGSYNMYAWLVNLEDGLLDYRWKTANYFLWPVRAGWGSEAGKYSLTPKIAGNGEVSVETESSRSVCTAGSADCIFPFAPADKITMTATPADGFTFAGWSGACKNTSGSCKVSMNGPVTVTATFVVAPPKAP